MKHRREDKKMFVSRMCMCMSHTVCVCFVKCLPWNIRKNLVEPVTGIPPKL